MIILELCTILTNCQSTCYTALEHKLSICICHLVCTPTSIKRTMPAGCTCDVNTKKKMAMDEVKIQHVLIQRTGGHRLHVQHDDTAKVCDRVKLPPQCNAVSEYQGVLWRKHESGCQSTWFAAVQQQRKCEPASQRSLLPTQNKDLHCQWHTTPGIVAEMCNGQPEPTLKQK